MKNIESYVLLVLILLAAIVNSAFCIQLYDARKALRVAEIKVDHWYTRYSRLAVDLGDIRDTVETHIEKHQDEENQLLDHADRLRTLEKE